jgi:branched-chain amino acid transport system ATP-binding protein
MSLLVAEHIGVQFGGVKAVHDVSLSLEAGQILGLIGPNGAGKTTLFNALTGFVPKASGKVMLGNRDITNTPPFELPKLGVARTFQVERPFEDLTVLENVMISSFLRHSQPKEAKHHATDVLEKVGLLDRANQKCSELNLARRRRLEIGKALALEPKVLFLDEVIAGLNPPAQSEMISFVKNLSETGIGIVMVEHIMRVIMTLSDRVICMAFGEKIAEGTPAEISQNPVVIDAYLGGGEDDD